MARRKERTILLEGMSFRFLESELNTAKRWWNAQGYSDEPISVILMSAVYHGVITPPDFVDDGYTEIE